MSTIEYSLYRDLMYPLSGYRRRYAYLSFSQSSNSSPRGPDGQLILKSNVWGQQRSEAVCFNWTDDPYPDADPGQPTFQLFGNAAGKRARVATSVQSACRGKFVAQLKNGNAAGIGVTIASAKQGFDMIRGSADRVRGVLRGAVEFYRSARSANRRKELRSLVNRGAVPTAGLVLEGFFGWAPLYEDLTKGAKIVANPFPPSSWMAARHGGTWQDLHVVQGGNSTSGNYTPYETRGAEAGCYAAAVRVDNPNMWLANQMGLIALPAIAWDLVPWSFVVNMFTNAGQVIGSMTDLAGVSLSNGSYTTRSTWSQTVNSKDWNPTRTHITGGTQKTVQRSRSVTNVPTRPDFMLRFPEWNVGLALISSSLMVQNVHKIHALAFGGRV